MKNIKAIIFDAYGTLFDVNSAAEKCKDKIGEKWEPFANFWRTTQLEYTWLRSLMRRHKDFWEITEDSLDKSMKAFKIDSSMKDELLNLYKVLSPFKEVHETLKKLKERKFKLAILSNGTPSLLNELVKTNKNMLECAYVGMGCMAMRYGVLEDTRFKYPWFFRNITSFNDDGKIITDGTSEDVSFIRNMIDSGIITGVMVDLSLRFGHEKSIVY